MLPLTDPAHLDYVMLSAHKLYAPFGTGALVGRRDTFEEGDPDLQGGGEVDIVTVDEVVWSAPPERDEAGSPNTVGAIALAAAICQLSAIGMDKVAEHEADLTGYALRKLKSLPGVTIYGNADPDLAPSRLGVIPFNLDGFSHFLVAAILGHEYGIGIRNGCFCAHPYILSLLGISENQARQVRQHILNRDRREVPGMLRVSFGLYNTHAEIDLLVDALHEISCGNYKGKYRQVQGSGEYTPEGWQVNFEQYFSL
jgi:cysteine desulfurase / selenocysteine lyase